MYNDFPPAISTNFRTDDGALIRRQGRTITPFSDDTERASDNYRNTNTMQGFISGNRSYTNLTGGHVDDAMWVAAKQHVTTHTTEDGSEVVTTSHFVRRRTKTTITDVSLDSMVNHLRGEDESSLSTDYPCRREEFLRMPVAFQERQQARITLPDLGCNGSERIFRSQQNRHHSSFDGQIGSKEVTLKNPSPLYYNNEPPSQVDVFSTMAATTNSFDSMVAQQRNEFIRMFPQFKHVKLAEPEVIVKNIVQPDGTVLTIETKMMRRQVEFRKVTTIVNGLIQSSTSRAIMVYGGPKDGYQLKFEQIQASPDDSEDDDDDDDQEANKKGRRTLSITGSETDGENNELALVRLDEINRIPENTTKNALVRLDTVNLIQQLKRKKLDKAWLSAKELVDTEQRYLSKLHLLDQVFRQKIEQIQDKPIDSDKISKLFSNVGSLYTFHSKHLLPSLENRLSEWPRNQKICDVMKELAPYLKMYSEYTHGYTKSTKIYYELKQKNKRFAAVVSEIQAMPECESLPLETHIICPVQRVARYQLLLQQYLDYLPADHIDRNDTEIALNKVKESASHANNLMRKIDKYKDVIEIQESLGNQIQGLLTPSRELLKKGRLTKISRRGGDFQERHVFLFNDLLLLCSDRRMPISKYKLRAALLFDGLQILEGDNLEHENTFMIRWKKKWIELNAKTHQDKTEWMDALWSAVQQYAKNRQSFGQARDCDTDSCDGSTKGGSKTCSICESSFKFLINEECTCKMCKKPVCKRCTKKESEDKCRICVECCDKKRSQSLHNLEAKAMSTDDKVAEKQCVIKGTLDIRSPKSAWSSHFFVLYSNSVLQSFKTETTPNGCSLLLHGSTVTLVDPRQDAAAAVNTFVFKIVHPNRVYYFKAPTQDELIKWMAALQVAAQVQSN